MKKKTEPEVIYRVQVLEVMAHWGWSRHMKVQRADGKDGITWDKLQELKNEYLGEDVSAVEFYPATSDLVDELNMRHLWEIPNEMLML